MPHPLALAPVPPRLAAAHPSVLIATFFWIGRLRPFPGTYGSLVAALAAWPILQFGSRALLVSAALLIFLLGLWASRLYSDADSDGDPASVVVDEVAAQWLVLSFVPLTAMGFLAGFLAFRLYDILKPWPIDWFERRLHGGWAIMFDDVVAAVYAAIVVHLTFFWVFI